jgi:5-oxoprolinase (ATP-hydrolysing) subunit B
VAAVAAAAAGTAGPADRQPGVGPRVTLAVYYDGADLADVAQLAGCSVDEVVRRHSGAEYTVAFCGFAPGFAYLTGLDPSLHVPRLSTPRARVPAGAVGVAGEYTAAYPRASPGGWRLIGRTDAALWSLERADPALLVPGTRVRFEPR